MTEKDFGRMPMKQILQHLRNQIEVAQQVAGNPKNWRACKPCYPNNTGQLVEVGDFIISARFRELLYSHVDPVPAHKFDMDLPLKDVSALRHLCERAIEIGRLYDELLYAVGNKHPGETRHQTALRYIRDAEKRSVDGPSAGQCDAILGKEHYNKPKGQT